MKKNKKLIFGMLTCVAGMTLLTACKTMHKKPLQDCSAIFESRDANNNAVSKKKKDLNKTYTDAEDVANQPPTECKVLEVKFDKKNKCEFVGSDKIDDFSKIISENKRDRVLLVVPESQFADLAKMAEKYMPSNEALNIKARFESDIFKSFNFPYKGVRCAVGGKKVVLWTGNKQVILTVKN